MEKSEGFHILLPAPCKGLKEGEGLAQQCLPAWWVGIRDVCSIFLSFSRIRKSWTNQTNLNVAVSLNCFCFKS